MSDLVERLRNMARFNDRREFGADYKDHIHWQAADRIDQLEQARDEARELAEVWRENARDTPEMPLFPWEKGDE